MALADKVKKHMQAETGNPLAFIVFTSL